MATETRTHSIIQEDMSVCRICGRPKECIHEIYYGRNRQTSIKNGFYIALCNECHNMSDHGVHFNKDLDMLLKRECQRAYEKTHTREEFIKLIGRNYLD